MPLLRRPAALARAALAAFAVLLAAPATGAAAPATYTLALGDAVPYGAVNGAPGSGARFQSFVDVLAARVATVRPGHTAVNYSCPGTTTADLVGPAASACQGPAQVAPYTGSQLDAGLAFLAAHPGEVSPIVLTAGMNDLLKGLDLDAMQSRVRATLAALRAAAPSADVVLAGYGDPLSLGQPDQPARYAAHAAFEQRLRAAAAAAGAVFVDPHPIFNASDAAICTYTRMCEDTDPHPTAEGHRVYAQLIWDALAYDQVRAPDTATFGTPSTGGTKVESPEGEVLAARASIPARFGAPRFAAGRRAVRVWVRCASDRPRTCRVLVVVRQHGRELGRARVRLAPGRAATLQVRLRRRPASHTNVQVSGYVGDTSRPTVRLTAR